MIEKLMISSPLGGWLFAYMFPGISVLAVIRFFPRHRAGTISRGAIVHGGLILSTILSQYLIYASGREFPWNFPSPSIFIFVGAVLFTLALLGRFGLFYAFSALLQQLTMTSIAYYLFDSLSFLTIVLLVVPFFSLSHLLQPKNWHVKIPVTFAWGLISLAIFALYGNLFLNASLHAALGSLFIYAGVMYPHAEFAIRRAKNPTANLESTDLI